MPVTRCHMSCPPVMCGTSSAQGHMWAKPLTHEYSKKKESLSVEKSQCFRKHKAIHDAPFGCMRPHTQLPTALATACTAVARASRSEQHTNRGLGPTMGDNYTTGHRHHCLLISGCATGDRLGHSSQTDARPDGVDRPGNATVQRLRTPRCQTKKRVLSKPATPMSDKAQSSSPTSLRAAIINGAAPGTPRRAHDQTAKGSSERLILAPPRFQPTTQSAGQKAENRP